MSIYSARVRQSTRRMFAFASMAGVAVGAVLIAPTAAYAHSKEVNLNRSGCYYLAKSSHTEASTFHDRPSACSGHAWLAYKLRGQAWSAWISGPDLVVKRGDIEASAHTSCASGCHREYIYH